MTRVKVDFNIKGMLDDMGLNPGGKVQTMLNNEILRISDPFVPFDTGNLKNKGAIEPSNTAISYSTPYARRLWYGEDFKFNGSPVRGSMWVDRAWKIDGNTVISNINKAIRNGVL